MYELVLGCGKHPVDGAVNIDRVPLPGVNITWDLDEGPWPLVDGVFDKVIAEHVFEHVQDPLLFMRECHRVMSPGGTLHITVPHWTSPNAFTDPTHRRFCTEQTWDYWVAGTHLHREMGEQYAGQATFQQVVTSRNKGDLLAVLLR